MGNSDNNSTKLKKGEVRPERSSKNEDEGSTAEQWEEGELGQSLEHAEVSSPQREKNLNDMIDEALELKMISIRLQEGLIDALKNMAKEKGIGYQPLIRQILTEHVRTESNS
jgi:predicted DNA binding CopG/RHH family protein